MILKSDEIEPQLFAKQGERYRSLRRIFPRGNEGAELQLVP